MGGLVRIVMLLLSQKSSHSNWMKFFKIILNNFSKEKKKF